MGRGCVSARGVRGGGNSRGRAGNPVNSRHCPNPSLGVHARTRVTSLSPVHSQTSFGAGTISHRPASRQLNARLSLCDAIVERSRPPGSFIARPPAIGNINDLAIDMDLIVQGENSASIQFDFLMHTERNYRVMLTRICIFFIKEFFIKNL